MLLTSVQLLTYIGEKKPNRVVSKYILQKQTDEHLYIEEYRHIEDEEGQISQVEENLFICNLNQTKSTDEIFIHCCVNRIYNNYIYYPSNTRQLIKLEYRRDK